MLKPLLTGLKYFAVFILCVSFYVDVSKANGGFAINPTNFDVLIKSTDPVEVKYKLTNDSEEDLRFEVKVAPEEAPVELSNGAVKIEIFADNEYQGIQQTIFVDIPANSELSLPVRISVDESQADKEISIPIVLEQVVQTQRLDDASYDLQITIKSELQSVKNSIYIEFAAAGFIVLGVVLMSLLLITRHNKSQEEEN